MNGNHHHHHHENADQKKVDQEEEQDPRLTMIRRTSHPLLDQQQQQQQQPNYDWLLLLRGPILIGLASLSIIISIVQSLSVTTLVQLLVLGLGLIILCYDSAVIGENQLRLTLHQYLNGIVWDDVLYQFWHPNIDWFRVYFVDNFIGLSASWMYLLPSTPQQRIQLIQAALRVSEEEANRILFQPGGYLKLVIPPFLLQWLQQQPEQQAEQQRQQSLEPSLVGVTSSSSSSSESSSSPLPSPSTPPPSPGEETLSHPDEEPSFVMVKPERQDQDDDDDAGVAPATTKKKNKESSSSSDNEKRRRRRQHQPPPPATTTKTTTPLLSETMKCIIIDTLKDQLRELLSSLTTTANNTKNLKKFLAGIGITTTTALALQLRYSPRARKIALGFLETTIMASLSTIGVGAMTSLFFLTNQWLLLGDNNNTISESNLITYISNVFKLCKSLSSSTTSTTTAGAGGTNDGSNNNNSYKKKGLLCTVVVALTMLGLQQQRRRKQQGQQFFGRTTRR